MSEKLLSTVLAGIITAGQITPEHVLQLRRAVFADAVVSTAEAEALFKLNDARLPACREWEHFFLEAITDILVRQIEPRGYVTEGKAKWLIDQINHDGVVDTNSEFMVLVKVLNSSEEVPDSLVNFALSQVTQAILGSKGFVGRCRTQAETITAQDVELLRSLFYANAGSGRIGISKDEAEFLFDLNDLTQGWDNDPAWQRFFVRAVANHLMAVTTYDAPSRDEALRRERWLSERGDIYRGLAQGGLSNIWKGFAMVLGGDSEQDKREAQIAELDAMVAEAERIDASEATWLIERLMRDGELTKNEKALLSFLKAESPDIHPDLKPLLARAA